MATLEWPTRRDKTATRGQKHGERDATDKKEGAESTMGGMYKVAQSGFLPIFGETKTETSLYISQNLKRPDWTA